MKTISKLGILFIFLTIPAVLLSSCQYRNENEKEASGLEEARQEMLSKLEQLKDDIDNRIEDIDHRMEGASDELKEGLDGAKEELLNERSELEKAMDDVKEATSDTWDEVSSFAENTYSSVRDGLQKINQDIEEWLE
jgi:ABC-type transporter Mla subunit MlaD